jgi:hypothetical protein
MIGINIASFSTFWDFHNFMVFEEFCVLSAKLCGLVPGGLPLQRTNVSNLGRLCRGPKQRCWTSFPAKKQNMLQIESGSNLPGLFHHFGLFSPFWRTFRSDFGPFLGNLATPITSTPGASPVSHRSATGSCQSHYTVLFSADAAVNPQESDKVRWLKHLRHWCLWIDT